MIDEIFDFETSLKLSVDNRKAIIIVHRYSRSKANLGDHKMRKRLFAALRWIEKSNKNNAPKITDRTQSNPESDLDLDPDSNLWDDSVHEHAMAYTEAELAARMGEEEWFLAYEMNASGVLRSEEDITTTYSLSLSSGGFAKVQCYEMKWDGGLKFQVQRVDC